MDNDTPPPPVSTRALLIHLLGENERMHKRLDDLFVLVTPPPPPKWYVRAFFWILDWRSTVIAGIAMIPWRKTP
jgi:hypothetical protein